MISKIIALSSSIRFWQLLFAAVLVVLGQQGVLTPEIANILAGLFGVSVTIGTIDKFSTK